MTQKWADGLINEEIETETEIVMCCHEIEKNAFGRSCYVFFNLDIAHTKKHRSLQTNVKIKI